MADEPQLFKNVTYAVCEEKGHRYPAMAGVCPWCNYREVRAPDRNGKQRFFERERDARDDS